MSLTSYRAAPPRANTCEFGIAKPQAMALEAGLRRGETQKRGVLIQNDRACAVERGKEAVVLGRPGNDLLSRVLRHSTIGAEEFNGRVRDGIGFLAPRSNHRTGEEQRQVRPQGSILGLDPRISLLQAQPSARSSQRPNVKGLSLPARSRTWIMRAIKPIERLVPVSSTRHRAYTSGLSTWSSSTALIGSTRFEGGFPLRCLQRLSRPYIAMLHCGWRHNSSTRGTSIPVLSY